MEQTNRYEDYLPVEIEQAECSETLAHKIQTQGKNYPEESIQHWNTVKV